MAAPSNRKERAAPPPVGHVLDTKSAAEYLAVSSQWLEIARVRGGGPPFVKIGRCVRYRKESLDRWLAEHEITNTGQVISHD